MSIQSLILIVLLSSFGLFKLMSLCKKGHIKLITKLYVLLAITYFIVGPRLIDFLNLGSVVEIMFFFSLYFAIVLSSLLGILVYRKEKPMMLEFLKSFALLVVLLPIRLMIG